MDKILKEANVVMLPPELGNGSSNGMNLSPQKLATIFTLYRDMIQKGGKLPTGSSGAHPDDGFMFYRKHWTTSG